MACSFKDDSLNRLKVSWGLVDRDAFLLAVDDATDTAFFLVGASRETAVAGFTGVMGELLCGAIGFFAGGAAGLACGEVLPVGVDGSALAYRLVFLLVGETGGGLELLRSLAFGSCSAPGLDPALE